MQAVADLIAKHGGFARLKDHPLKLLAPPYQPLHVEYVGATRIGVRGGLVSVAHYAEANGDLCADPDLCLFVPAGKEADGAAWLPTEFTQHLLGVYTRVDFAPDGYCETPRLLASLREFAAVFDANIREQFADAEPAERD